MAKKQRLPEFLGAEYLTVKEKEQCADILTNWMKTHAVISKLTADDRSLATLRRLMLCEYLRVPGPRMDIIVRLHGRYDTLRYEVERVQLFA